MSLIVNFLKDESGVTSAEYTLIFSLIALAVIGGSPTLRTAICVKLSTIVTNINHP